MKITGKELAKKLNISAAAVSMALNNKPGVSTKTRRIVYDAAEKYGYDFTRISDKVEIPGTICVVIYKKHGAIVTDTPFFSQLTEGIASSCKKHNHKMSISYIREGEDTTEQIEDIKFSGYAGIILLGTEMLPNDIKPFLDLKIPIVLLDTYYDTLNCDSVLINNVQGAYLATTHLIRQCGKQPGYLKSSYLISNFSQRSHGFFDAVRDAGMSASKSVVHKLTPSTDGAYYDMLEVIDSGEELAKCYFADNDLIALGAIKALFERGFRVPNDISIVGFDNISVLSLFGSELTTIDVPKKFMGETAVDRLVAIIKSPKQPHAKIEIMTSLIKRASVKAIKEF